MDSYRGIAMKQYAEHNRIGICHALRGDDMYVRVFSGGYPYLKDSLILRSSSISPIYSYGKNYEKDNKKFALFVWTTESDQSKIESLFEDTLLRITDKQLLEVSHKGSFTYIDSV